MQELISAKTSLQYASAAESDKGLRNETEAPFLTESCKRFTKESEFLAAETISNFSILTINHQTFLN